MLDEGCVAIVPVKIPMTILTLQVRIKSRSMRTGKILEWFPSHVKARGSITSGLG
ncbi:MAG: hypothetical protein ACLT76_09300 [Clostridium fessum]